jgi:hypothetical protein
MSFSQLRYRLKYHLIPLEVDLSGRWNGAVALHFTNVLRAELANCSAELESYNEALGCVDHMEFQFYLMFTTWKERPRRLKVHKSLLKWKIREVAEKTLKLRAQVLDKSGECNPQGLIRRVEQEHK